MIIESIVHLEGARELIRRYEESLRVSSLYMDKSGFDLLSEQIQREISRLNVSIQTFEQKRTVPIVSNDWFTLPFSTEGAHKKDTLKDLVSERSS